MDSRKKILRNLNGYFDKKTDLKFRIPEIVTRCLRSMTRCGQGERQGESCSKKKLIRIVAKNELKTLSKLCVIKEIWIRFVSGFGCSTAGRKSNYTIKLFHLGRYIMFFFLVNMKILFKLHKIFTWSVANIFKLL